MLLTLAERPGGLAGHGAALAGDAAVDVEDEGELAARKRLRVGIIHLPADLPVGNLTHRRAPLVARSKRSSRSNRSIPLLHPPPRRGGGTRWGFERSEAVERL